MAQCLAGDGQHLAVDDLQSRIDRHRARRGQHDQRTPSATAATGSVQPISDERIAGFVPVEEMPDQRADQQMISATSSQVCGWPVSIG